MYDFLMFFVVFSKINIFSQSINCNVMHSNIVAKLPVTVVANLPILWRTFLWRTFPVANLPVFEQGTDSYIPQCTLIPRSILAWNALPPVVVDCTTLNSSRYGNASRPVHNLMSDRLGLLQVLYALGHVACSDGVSWNSENHVNQMAHLTELELDVKEPQWM